MNKLLGVSLERPVAAKHRREILQGCWDLQLSDKEYENQSIHFDAYFRHYEEQCEQCSNGAARLTHQDVLQVIDLLKSKTKRDCKVALIAKAQAEELPAADWDRVADDWILFAGRSLLCVDLSLWKDDELLVDFNRRVFLLPSAQADNVRLPRSFNAKNLAQVAGFRIKWTSSLQNHLKMSDNDEEVMIFHHARILRLIEGCNFGLFPKDFLDETQRSISLLLPTSDANVRRWFRKQCDTFHLDDSARSSQYLRVEGRNLNKFSYWRDRLIVIKEAYDDHEPRSLLQSWRDDRRPVQWWTFWIAVVVFVLAVIQVVEGGLQTYKAYHPG